MDRIAIVGAGIAGLACAQALAAAGRPVRVYEKSRGLSGRAATRRRDGPAFDHGAPAFAAADPAFVEAVADWVRAGHAALWPRGEALGGYLVGGVAPSPRTTTAGVAAAASGPAPLVGLPGMSGLGAAMAEGLDIRLGVRIAGLSRAPGGWRLATENGSVEGPFPAVVLAVPAPQAAALIAEAGLSAEALAAVEMEPCWTAMASFDTALPAPDAMLGDGAPLALAARNSAKPGRAAVPEAWVLHAGPGWTRAHLEDTHEAAAAALLEALAARTGRTLPPPATLTAHRWLYARTARALGAPCLWDADARLGACGDWCLGRGIEEAWRSGRALAAEIAAAG